jgi:SSS family solute:Na+ symporter
MGMLCGFIANVYFWQFTKVPFTWYVAMGSILTFMVGYASSLITSHPAAKSPISGRITAR